MAAQASARDIPGRKREYETIYILRPELTNDAISQVNTKIRGVIETGGGQLIKVENWGKRRLAYEVKKQLKGIYLFFNYLGGSQLVEEVERNLRLSDQVIRYYTIKAGENIDPASRTSQVTDESFAQAAVPGPDEEAIVTGQAAPTTRTFGGDDDEEGAFDFEEAVFGKVESPRAKKED